jgi:hypothetical protein
MMGAIIAHKKPLDTPFTTYGIIALGPREGQPEQDRQSVQADTVAVVAADRNLDGVARAKIPQAGETATRKAHNLEIPGATPGPATK